VLLRCVRRRQLQFGAVINIKPRRIHGAKPILCNDPQPVGRPTRCLAAITARRTALPQAVWESACSLARMHCLSSVARDHKMNIKNNRQNRGYLTHGAINWSSTPSNVRMSSRPGGPPVQTNSGNGCSNELHKHRSLAQAAFPNSHSNPVPIASRSMQLIR